MQRQKTKATNFINRLKKRSANLRKSYPPPLAHHPEIILPQVSPLIPCAIDQLKEKGDYFERLEQRLHKKLNALKVNGIVLPVYSAPSVIEQHKKKLGIMDNIGEIFECSYSAPPSTKKSEI